MEFKSNKRIFIIDDDKYSLEAISNHLYDKYQIYNFQYSEDLLSHDLLKEANLFIIDIRLDNESGISLSLDLQNMGIRVPRLYISGFSPYEFFEQISKDEHEYIYDFVSKPLDFLTFFNRINILLKVSTYQKYLHEEQDLAESALWNLLINNSNFFIISTDRNLKIKSCSLNLIKILEYETNNIVGKNWSDFIDSDFKKFMYDFKDKKDVSKYCEITGNVINNSGISIPVKWFVSLSNNELFGVGTILTQEIYKRNNINSIRSYFKTMLERDSVMIESIKQPNQLITTTEKEQLKLCQ